jgi:hypothetical protein
MRAECYGFEDEGLPFGRPHFPSGVSSIPPNESPERRMPLHVGRSALPIRLVASPWATNWPPLRESGMTSVAW